MEKVNWIRESISNVKKAAERCNPHAMYELATRYLTGRGVYRDDAEGLHWAREAARRGHVKGMVLAGCCLARGIGEQGGAEEAAAWFKKATYRGSAAAYYNLGGCYLLGIGKPQSKKAALIYYRSAAEMGYERAGRAVKVVEATDVRQLAKIAEAVGFELEAR